MKTLFSLMKNSVALFYFFFTLVFGTVLFGCAENNGVSTEYSPKQIYGENGMVATQDATATEVGLNILKNGGNAIDAAVAIGFTLAVTLPRAGNLGGGGFMIVHSKKSGETVAIDYRETAPLASFRDMYLDAEGHVVNQKSQYSYLSVGIPGTVAGLTLALKKYGTMPLEEVIAPALRLAKEGIKVNRFLSDNLKENQNSLMKWPASRKIFFNPNGEFFKPGEILIQSDLAWSLKQIQTHGPNAFYKGEIAAKIVEDVKAHGGIITLEDFKSYQAIIRNPLRGTYRGLEIVSMPPPSSGGTHLIQILNILEGYPISKLKSNSPKTIHLMAEAMKLAYADRSQHLGDPDFWKVPLKGLTSKAYAKKLRQTIDPDHARPSKEIAFGNPLPYKESHETTHFSVMDKDGNVVSNTYTLNFAYGSGIVANGTGILLNNEMDDFSSKPGTPNAYGLIGGEANAIRGRKRPLSSMSPTIVFKEGRPLLATGSPGGSQIISVTLQLILNVVDHKMDINLATLAPRIHHQWLPDELLVEEGIPAETIRSLSAMGHNIRIRKSMGSTQSTVQTNIGFLGSSDTRRPGAKAMGY